MSFVSLPGQGPLYPSRLYPINMQPSVNGFNFDATGEKVAFCGRFWNKDRATKNITGVGFLFNSVTKAGGSGITVSLQDVSLTAGPPMRPDEVQDQSVNIANGDSGFTSNAWYNATLGSTRSGVGFDDYLAVVWEYDGSGRLGADNVLIAGAVAQYSTPHRGNAVAQKASGTWVQSTAMPLVVFICDDGSFGTLSDAFPFSALNSHTYASNSNPDEFAMEFSPPVPMKVDGLWADVSTTADFDLVLYEGTTALASCSFDSNHQGTSSARIAVGTIAEQTLTPGTTYRVAVKPTTTSSLTVYSFDVNNAGHLACHDGGTAFTYTNRVDAGSWAAATSTRRLYCGVRISALHDGTGGNQGKRAARGGGRAA